MQVCVLEEHYEGIHIHFITYAGIYMYIFLLRFEQIYICIYTFESKNKYIDVYKYMKFCYMYMYACLQVPKQ